MRIDQNRPAREPSAPDAVRRTSSDETRPLSGQPGLDAGDAESGHVELSKPAVAAALITSEAKISALRLQIQKGEYRVSAEEIAGKIIDDNV